MTGDGSFTYDPIVDWCGADSFSYYADDGVYTSSTVTVTITVTCTNDVPVIDDDTGVIAENASTGTLVVTISGSDADGDSISYVITAGNGDGIFSISGDQIIV